MGPFLRLVHISDLHFGDNFIMSAVMGTPIPRGVVRALARARLPLVPGLEIHDDLAARALSTAIKSHRLDAVPLITIASGDLTTFGTLDALKTAMVYLRSQHIVGSQKFGLNDPSLPLVPGNHDTWGGNVWGYTKSVALPRPEFDRVFADPAPGGDASPYPYRLRLCESPPIYLYGLDSCRLEQMPKRRYLNLQRRKFNGLIAEGYVDPDQLDKLAALISDEPPRPRFRIAVIHHAVTDSSKFLPLIHVGKVNIGRLINRSEVVAALEKLDFRLVLTGHLHAGFTDSAVDSSALKAFSVGTATQKVHLKRAERRALAVRGVGLSDKELSAKREALSKANEYRIYEFFNDRPGPNGLVVVVLRRVFDPSAGAFVQMTRPSVLHF
jgi:3',5'-cyclic AMP phosphodiesterase CpdA